MNEKMEIDCKRGFESGKIDWEIQNFCFACRPENCTIYSPEFSLQGINFVQWRMSLRLVYDESSKHSVVSFHLEACKISKSKNVCVNWSVTLGVGSKIFGPYNRNTEFGERCEDCEPDITTTDKILEDLLPFHSDKLCIELYIIVFDEEKPLKPSEKTADGLLYLSKDLEKLKEADETYKDIKLEVNGMYIEAHKAVLSLNDKFEDYIKEANNDIIKIADFDYITLDNFVNFLYSGNVDHFLRNPTISMIRCMKHFNYEALKAYYVPEELTMTTKIKAETHDFHWIVADILHKHDFVITSPPIKKLNATTIWNLTVSLETDDPNDFFSIFATIIDGEKPRYFCLEFAIENDIGESFFPRRLLRTNQCYDNMGFKDFVVKEALFEEESLSEEPCVRFLFRIKTSDGSQETSMGCHMMSFVSFTEVQPYERLSEGIAELLENKKHSDIVLKCGDKTIEAHKCILVSRSPGFRQMIEKESSDKNTLTLTDVEPEVLELIINYIYTGVLKNLDSICLKKLYSASSNDKLDIPSLYKESREILRKRFLINDKGVVITKGEKA